MEGAGLQGDVTEPDGDDQPPAGVVAHRIAVDVEDRLRQPQLLGQRVWVFLGQRGLVEGEAEIAGPEVGEGEAVGASGDELLALAALDDQRCGAVRIGSARGAGPGVTSGQPSSTAATRHPLPAPWRW